MDTSLNIEHYVKLYRYKNYLVQNLHGKSIEGRTAIKLKLEGNVQVSNSIKTDLHTKHSHKVK